MKTRRLVGWVIMIIPFIFWLYSISSANLSGGEGFFANAYAYQIMVMGGAISTIAALTLFIDW